MASTKDNDTPPAPAPAPAPSNANAVHLGGGCYAPIGHPILDGYTPPKRGARG